MTRKIAFSLLFIALTVISLRPATAATPIAVLLFSAGEVTIQRQDGSSVAVTYGLQLFQGDVVSTTSKSRAEIHFQNGAWVELGPRSTMSIKPPKYHEPLAQPATAEKSFQMVQSFLKLKDTEGANSLASVRSASENVEVAEPLPR